MQRPDIDDIVCGDARLAAYLERCISRDRPSSERSLTQLADFKSAAQGA